MIIALGRACLGFIFVLSAVQKIFQWKESEEGLTQALTSAMLYFKEVSWLHDGIAFFATWSSLLFLVAFLFELIGGVLVMLGLKVRFGALLLILFLFPVTFFFHGFWADQSAQYQVQVAMFLKNLSIFGGLLILLGTGSPKSCHESSSSE